MAFDSCTSEKMLGPEPEYTAASSDNVPNSLCILHLEN
jgi:hypothetical protein